MDDAIPRPSWKLALVKWLSITMLIAWPLLLVDLWISHGCIEMPAERAWRFAIFGLIFPLEIIFIGRKWYRLPYSISAGGVLAYFGFPLLLDSIQLPEWVQPPDWTLPFPLRDYADIATSILPYALVVLAIFILLSCFRRIIPAIKEYIVVTLVFPLTMLLGFLL